MVFLLVGLPWFLVLSVLFRVIRASVSERTQKAVLWVLAGPMMLLYIGTNFGASFKDIPDECDVL